VLVLSQFTGAARDLTEALIVNPYDYRASERSPGRGSAHVTRGATERMRSMRRIVSEFNVYRWAGRMLIDAAELRRKERLLGRFGAPRISAEAP
jgi:trehalose-6-phosphate synthase